MFWLMMISDIAHMQENCSKMTLCRCGIKRIWLFGIFAAVRCILLSP